MRSFLAVTTPATDLALLDAAELRAAAGITDASRDADLAKLGLAVARAIAAECNIAAGSGAAPTLKRERLTETFYGVAAEDLMLARRHDVAIVSVLEDGTALPSESYIADAESGFVTRLSGGQPSCWRAQAVVVVYDAGFATVPDDLKRVATELVRQSWLESVRDPLLKSERVNVPGVRDIERQYWVGAVPGQASMAPVPQALAGGLMRFRNVVIA